MRRVLAIAAAVVATAACGACADPYLDTGVYVIRNGTLIDGTGAPPRPNTSVVIDDGRIRDIVDDRDLRTDADVPTFDASGQWILPGFVDTHAHLPGPDALAETFEALLAHGVTAARSTASVTAYGVGVRDEIEAGTLVGPTYKVAGALIDGPDSGWGFAARVASAEEARAEVRAQASAGVDYIKVYTLLPPDIVGAAIDEAHALGLEVIGHLGRTSWFEAVDLEIDALTHSAIAGLASSMVPVDRRAEFSDFFIPNAPPAAFDPGQFTAFRDAVDEDVVRELGRLLAERGTVLDPNLVLMDAVIRGDDPDVFRALVPDAQGDFVVHPYSASWSAAERVAALEARTLFFQAIGIFHEEGALLTVGTDIGNPWMTPGVSFHRELELLAEAGLDNHAVIRAATRNGAIALGREDELGTLEVGKRADVVVLAADPLTDIRNTRSISAVYRAGRPVGTR